VRLPRKFRALAHPLALSVARSAERRLIPLSVAVGAALSAAFGVGVARALPPPSNILPLAEVKAGMVGYGLTVFSGTTPEKFRVEIISTLHNFRPNQDLILIKTPHPRLEVTRTVAGMSGSPIYLNDKMIGAYAYGWTFGAEAIAGVTPIQSMIDELNRPLPRAVAPRGGVPFPATSGGASSPRAVLDGSGVFGAATPPASPRSFAGAPSGYDLFGHAKQLAARAAVTLAPPEGSSLARASTPILLGGMGNLSVKLASDLLSPMGLEPLQAGGGSSGKPDPTAPAQFVDGGAIGVELVRGDISAMGLGTVTRVTGDKLVAFGHPMLGGGVESLPTAVARVHWLLASQNRSFKIGEAVRSLGALVNDRQAAIVVDASAKAPTFPMRVEIQGVPGVPKPIWDVEVTHDQFMAPSFAAMAIGSALETTAAERGDMTWRATSKLKVAKYGTVTLVDVGAGNGNPVGPDDFGRAHIVKALGALLNNPWESVTVERVDTAVRVTLGREVETLRGAKVLEPEIDAGQPARIRLDLQPYLGKPESKLIEVKIPPELAGRDVEIELAPGYEVERPDATPNSVAELFASLVNQTFDPDSVVATIRLANKEAGAAFHGLVASRLPPGAVDTLRPSSQSDAPETFSVQVQTAIPLQRFLVGKDTVRVHIRPVLR
jgi:SpoIVB peptidase S55